MTLSDCKQVLQRSFKVDRCLQNVAKNVTLTSRTEQRIVIKPYVPVGMTPMDTHMFVYTGKLKPNCSLVKVFRWHNILSDGCDDIGDCKRSARPKIVTENAM